MKKLVLKSTFFSFMNKHKISWRHAGEIPPAFLKKILQLIMEKYEKWLF